MRGPFSVFKGLSKDEDYDDRNDFKTGVYYSNWSVYQRKHFAIEIPADKLTHLFYAFLAIDASTGEVKLSDAWCDTQMPMQSPKDPNKKVAGSLQQIFQIKQLNRKLKVLASIGGWGTDHAFTEVTKDSKKLDKFVSSALWHVTEYGFDGLDIDWEYPKNSTENSNFLKLLAQLRKGLDDISKSLLLTVASPAGDEQLQVLNLKALDKYISFWNVMCYDFNGESWSQRIGYHSNLFGNNGENNLNGSDVVNHYIKAGVNPNKLILGMPLYGRVFHGASASEIGLSFDKNFRPPNSIETDVIDYKQIPSSFAENFDPYKVSAISHDSSRQVIVYDSVQSVRIKSQFIKLNKIGGGMWWDSCGDSPDPQKSLIHQFVDQLGGTDILEKQSNHLDIYGKSNYLSDVL